MIDSREAKDILSDSLKTVYNLKEPQIKIYAYSDKSGNYLTILNEQKGIYTLGKNDTTNVKATAVNLKSESGKLSKTWTLEKEVLPDFVVGVQDIHFLNEQLEFSDLNNDSLVEPILVYQTFTERTLSIIYKNQIVSIAHQFKGYDFNTLNIDTAFYALPSEIIIYLQSKLHLLELSTQNALPKGWEKGMKKQKTLIRAR